MNPVTSQTKQSFRSIDREKITSLSTTTISTTRSGFVKRKNSAQKKKSHFRNALLLKEIPICMQIVLLPRNNMLGFIF